MIPQPDSSSGDTTSRKPAPASHRSHSERDRQFAEIALPLLPTVARIAIALTRDEADADDLVQDTFLQAYRRWETFTVGTDCRRWMATICRNEFFRRRHRERRSISVDDDELELLGAARAHNQARDAGVDDMFTRLDVGPAITGAIALLPAVFRDVVVLSDVEGFSYEEIALLLDVPVGTVRSRLYRARRRLQDSLLSYAVDAGIARPRVRTPEKGGE
ncbi:MAG: sigma-70 family RNA polymerase sigma factor [Gemmatimonadaceae bacterium]